MEKASRILGAMGGMFIFLGMFLIVGSVGSDCDGACMENAMSLSDILLFTFLGFGCIITGIGMIRGVVSYE